MPKSDQLPMMEHEAGLAREFSDEKHEGTVFVKQYERQSSLKLAIVTMLVFVSAIAFLMLFLVTPIFYSLSHPAQHDTSNNSHGSMVMPHDESMPHEHHGEDDDRKRRSADDHLAVAFRDRIKELCPCLSSLDAGEIFSPEFKKCIRSCKLWADPDSEDSI